jgi:hypothetical protein
MNGNNHVNAIEGAILEGQPPAYENPEPLVGNAVAAANALLIPHQEEAPPAAGAGGRGEGGGWLLPRYGAAEKIAIAGPDAQPRSPSNPTLIIPMGAQVTGTFAQIPGPQYHAQIANNSTIIASSPTQPRTVNSNDNGGIVGPIAIAASPPISPLQDSIPTARHHPQERSEEHPFSVSPRDVNDGIATPPQPSATAVIVGNSPGHDRVMEAALAEMNVPMASLAPPSRMGIVIQQPSILLVDRSAIVSADNGVGGVMDDIPFAVHADSPIVIDPVPSRFPLLPPSSPLPPPPPYDHIASRRTSHQFPPPSPPSDDFVTVEKT